MDMARIKEIATAAGTLGCAVGIGFVMQSSETAAQRYGTGAAEAAIPAAKDISRSSAMLEVEAITLTAAEYETKADRPAPEPVITPVAASQDVMETPDEAPASAAREPICEMTANARPVAAAMVHVTMDAACLPNERLTIHHNGMIFTQVTSDTGQLSVTMPALSRDAVFVLAFGNGEGAVAQTVVEDLDDFNRVAVQWKGQSGFEIHAREYGAGYGEKGHIWHGAPGAIADAVTGQGGFITRHGDMSSAEPLVAEVYSFPARSAAHSGEIALSVETQVTEANCGLEIEAQVFQIAGDGTLNSQNVSMSVPGCDTIGDFLVLNNLLQDLKVAAK